MSRLAALAGAALAGALLLSGCARGSGPGAPGAVGAGGGFVVAGVVRDRGGLPIGGVPVQAFASPGPVSPDPRLGQPGLALLAGSDTAADGTYRLSFAVPPGPARYYSLSFYVSGRFDEVRFARPDRVDMTSQVKPDGHWVFDLTIPFHGAWPKVQEVLKAHASGSAKALVIRGYGIAEEVRIKQDETGVEVWWYYSRGKSFTFRGDERVGETTFAPVLK